MVGPRCCSQRRKGICYECSSSLTDRYQNRLQSTRKHDDFVRLHEAARHTAHSFETLGVSIDTVGALRQEILEACSLLDKQDKSDIRATKQIHKHIGAQLRMMQNLQARSLSNKDRLQNEIALVRTTLLQQDYTTDKILGLQHDRPAR